MVNEVLDQGRRLATSQSDAGPPVLVGIKRQDWRARPEAARKLGRKLAERGEIAYWVVSRRRFDRGTRAPISARTLGSASRLRSAKLLDGGYRFVCEGRICDRSRDGLRLALARDITLPRKLAVHIDETSEVREATSDLAARVDDRHSPAGARSRRTR